MVGLAEFDQRDHRVQPVGRLVGLRPQRVREPLHAIQFAAERFELGVVAQGEHGADGLALDQDRPPADQQHPVVGQRQLVGEVAMVVDQRGDVVGQSGRAAVRPIASSVNPSSRRPSVFTLTIRPSRSISSMPSCTDASTAS